MKPQEMVRYITGLFMETVTANGLQDDAHEVSVLARNIFDSIGEAINKNSSGQDFITAPNGVVEVIDEKSGRIFRRYLELGFEENDNGLRLSGETMEGKPTDIVFLSDAAIRKLSELKGKGPDNPRCDD